MKQNNVFVRWWLIFSLITFGIGAAFWFGLFNKVNEADVTKISFLIFCVFIAYSVKTGVWSYRCWKFMNVYNSMHTDKDLWIESLDGGERNSLIKQSESGWFVSDMLLTLGMIGTVLGFIYMLGISFTQINISNVSSLQGALTSMAKGMSTALYTTAAGLICSLLLKLQMFNLSQTLRNAN